MEIINYFNEMWNLAIQGQARGILFYVAIYAFVLLFYSVIFQRKVNSWPSTIGNLENIGIRYFGYTTERTKSTQEYVVTSLYTYTVDGIEYHGRRASPWAIIASHNMLGILKHQLKNVQHTGDGKVKVFYSPRNPKKSYLIKPGVKGQVVTLILALIPMALYWSKYHA